MKYEISFHVENKENFQNGIFCFRWFEKEVQGKQNYFDPWVC